MTVTITEESAGSDAITYIKVVITAAAADTYTREFSGLINDIWVDFTSGTIDLTLTDESGKDILGCLVTGANTRTADAFISNSDLGGPISFRGAGGGLTGTQTGAGAGTVWIGVIEGGTIN